MTGNTVLLTGATGALGSMLLPRLVAKGYRVLCLVRPKGGLSGEVRFLNSLPPSTELVNGDILQPQCAVDESSIMRWQGKIGSLIHCAASINFDLDNQGFATNIDGVKNTLSLADRLGVVNFHHISTAYVAGDAENFDETDFYNDQTWRNLYEQSKYIGEGLVRSWAMHEVDRRFTIYRPSILIGCNDGYTPTFDGYYGHFRAVAKPADALRQQSRDNLPLLGDNVSVPFVFLAGSGATLNLVPIDWVSDMITELSSTACSNTTFHLVNPDPPEVRWVIETSIQILKITGSIIVESQKEKCAEFTRQPPLIRRLQRQINRVHDAYLPYVMGEPVFRMNRARQILEDKYKRPPEIDEPYLRRLLLFAVGANWRTSGPMTTGGIGPMARAHGA